MKTHPKYINTLTLVFAALAFSLTLIQPALADVFLTTGSLATARGYPTETLLPNGKVLVAGGLDHNGLPTATSELYNPATGSWTAITSPMTTARYNHTAILLPNGKVLVAGGIGASGPLANAELYDPNNLTGGPNGTWAAITSMATTRSGQTVTLLPNGKVLVAGGVITTGYTSAGLYDPVANSWANTAPMNTSRYSHTATLLPNGKVLVAGGYNGGYLANAELYDPVANSWTAVVSPMNSARSSHTATLLPNGMVLVAGGGNSGGNLASAELFDPYNLTGGPNGTWTPTGTLNIARELATATLLRNGLVLVAGGAGAGGSLASAELYNPAVGTWVNTTPLVTARSIHVAALLPNGMLLVAGGFGTSGSLANAELYDYAPSANWLATGSMITGHADGVAALLPNGKVLVAGDDSVDKSAQIYDPATGTWTPTDPMNIARVEPMVSVLLNGNVLVAGGSGDNSAEVYNPTTGHWNRTDNDMSDLHGDGTATLLPNGKVLVAGGGGGQHGNDSLTTSELYDPASGTYGTWTVITPMEADRVDHSAILLPNGKVLVAGGYRVQNSTVSSVQISAEVYDPNDLTGGPNGTWNPTDGAMQTVPSDFTMTLLPTGKVLAAGGDGQGICELYDPTSGVNGRGTWSLTGSLNYPRAQGTATLLPNGLVIVVGGNDAGNVPSNAELYDPATGVWTLTGVMNNKRVSQTTTLLPNGLVLVAGGFDENINGPGGTLSSAELFDYAPSGSFLTTGSLADGRGYPTETLLPNGMVLVAGGLDHTGFATANAELFNPATGTWIATGNTMTAARYSHTATLLPNGRVLVAGGTGGGASAEVFDPYDPTFFPNGKWSAVNSMTVARTGHTATLLPSGKVLVAGGTGTSGSTSAETYDPNTGVGGTWTDTTPMITFGRSGHTATLLPNGKVLVAGGYNGAYLNSVELYDPVANLWTQMTSMATTRTSHSMTLLPNWTVLVAGGFNGGYLATAEIYDPNTGIGGTWTPTTGPLNTAREQATATLLCNGLVLVAGGAGTSGYLASAELYNPAGRTWANTSPLLTARNNHAVALLPNGMLLVAGGFGASGSLAGAELYNYDPTTTWATTSSMANGRGYPTATLLPNGMVLEAGGIGSMGPLSSAALYNPTTATWTPTYNNMTTARYGHTATLLPNGKVLVAGGTGAGASAQLYDPYDQSLGPNGKWTLGSSMTVARTGHTATLLPNGKVLVAGGVITTGFTGAELYDPVGNSWSDTAPMVTSRQYHTATLLPNGKVLVAGGYNNGYLNKSELYDPSANSWTPMKSMTTARELHTATLLPNGLVLVAGGFNGGYLANSELYDPNTGVGGTWTATGTLNTPREQDTATLLPNGLVLVVGGAGTSGYLASAELYNPAVGIWSGANSLATARNNHTTVLLPNGTLLVSGGFGTSGSLASAELDFWALMAGQ